MNSTRELGRSLNSPLNPSTGRAWSLLDPEVRARVAALKDSLREPAKAQKFLSDAGILDSSGKLTKRYGG